MKRERTGYDVVIVGASFAGLAVASRLRGRVLLIDRNEIGEGQTSACATTLSLVLRMAGADAVLQVHEVGYLHVSRLCLKYALPVPMCTFDYRAFCRSVLRHTRAEFLQAAVKGTDGVAVLTDRGAFEGRHLIDASGWRATLASSLNPAFRGLQHLAFALESEVDLREDALHFWLDTDGKIGYGWCFPCGRFSRVGWGNYAGTSGLKERVVEFTHSLGAEIRRFHGGFLSCGLENPVEGGVFLVGDAAGQCLPLTGEGIRPAVYFGQRLGDIIRDVLDQHITKAQAIEAYNRLVSHFRPSYSFLETLQKGLKQLPPPVLMLFGWLSAALPLSQRALARYARRFPILPTEDWRKVLPSRRTKGAVEGISRGGVNIPGSQRGAL